MSPGNFPNGKLVRANNTSTTPATTSNTPNTINNFPKSLIILSVPTDSGALPLSRFCDRVGEVDFSFTDPKGRVTHFSRVLCARSEDFDSYIFYDPFDLYVAKYLKLLSGPAILTPCPTPARTASAASIAPQRRRGRLPTRPTTCVSSATPWSAPPPSPPSPVGDTFSSVRPPCPPPGLPPVRLLLSPGSAYGLPKAFSPSPSGSSPAPGKRIVAASHCSPARPAKSRSVSLRP